MRPCVVRVFGSTGYTVRWTALAGSTELYLADLDPGKRWRVEVDGRLLLPPAETSQHMTRVTVSGAGAHTLVVKVLGGAGGGLREALTPPPTPGGLRILQ